MGNNTTFSGSISAVTANNQYFQIEDVTKSAVSVDNQLANVNILHISQDDYNQLVANDAMLSNTLYIVSSDYVETYGQQIKNIAPATDLSDAVNLEQLSNIIDENAINFQPKGNYLSSNALDSYKTYVDTVSSLSNDGYTTQEALNNISDAAFAGNEAKIQLVNALSSTGFYSGIELSNITLGNVISAICVLTALLS